VAGLWLFFLLPRLGPGRGPRTGPARSQAFFCWRARPRPGPIPALCPVGPGRVLAPSTPSFMKLHMNSRVLMSLHDCSWVLMTVHDTSWPIMNVHVNSHEHLQHPSFFLHGRLQLPRFRICAEFFGSAHLQHWISLWLREQSQSWTHQPNFRWGHPLLSQSLAQLQHRRPPQTWARWGHRHHHVLRSRRLQADL